LSGGIFSSCVVVAVDVDVVVVVVVDDVIRSFHCNDALLSVRQIDIFSTQSYFISEFSYA